MFERITGRAFPPNWIIHEDERAVLSENEPVTHDQLSRRNSQPPVRENKVKPVIYV
jgi:hypothetical protein